MIRDDGRVERPILFSAAMVNAIKEGCKTQTRRAIRARRDWLVGERGDGALWPFFRPYVYAEPEPIEVPCPYGKPGDLLWVKSSRYTPRADSRILLEVVDVRVEHVRGISVEDALAEGIERHADDDGVGHADPYYEFRRLWDSINDKKIGCAWVDNPWVWVIEFFCVEVEG